MSTDIIKNRKGILTEFLFLSIVIISILLFIRFFTPILASPDPEFFRPNDHTHYINMAKEPFKPRVAIAPFCYRILVPLIAWILPFSLSISGKGD